MYYIYLNQFNIIIPRYSGTAPTNEYYLDSWRFINVILIITVISAYVLTMLIQPSYCVASTADISPPCNVIVVISPTRTHIFLCNKQQCFPRNCLVRDQNTFFADIYMMEYYSYVLRLSKSRLLYQ